MRRFIAAAFILGALLSVRAEAAAPIGNPVATLSLSAKAFSLQLVGDLAYIATGTGMVIVNVATPTTPTIVGRVPASTAYRSEAVVVNGSYAYLASPVSGLVVVDITNLASPKVVATRRVSGGLWDITLKDHVLYGVSFGGEMFLFDIEGPTKAKAPVQIKVLGLPAWASAGGDATNIQRLKDQVTTGNAKSAAVATAGKYVFAADWAYGRLYAWDATDPEQPVFAGTHYAPYILQVVPDLANDVIYMLSAFGSVSGIYTMPISLLDPDVATRHATCAACGYLRSLFAVDMGGLAAVPGGDRIVWAGGKGAGEVHVVNVQTPTAMVDEFNGTIGSHGVPMASSMGLATKGDYLILSAGLLGLRIYHVPTLAP
jgi:hypothetical protein